MPVFSLPIGSAWVERSRKAGQIDSDVDSPARSNHRVTCAQFRTYEELATLSSVESCANFQGFVNGHGCEIANCQLAREGRLLQFADYEAGNIVERSGDDAAVGTTGRTFERPPQHNVGDHFTIVESHVEFDASRIRATAYSTVFEPASAQD